MPQAAAHRKRKLSELEGRPGLFIAHVYAEPKAHVKCSRFSTPAGFEALNQGTYGDVFVSNDRKTVHKYFVKKEEALHEYKMWTHVMELAPQYTAGPAQLIRKQNTASSPDDFSYVLSTQNAGPTLLHRMKVCCPSLTADELCLCLLQTIHFTLLLGNEIQVADHHEENICVARSGSQIQVRWIDFGLWEESTDQVPRRFVLCENALQLCNLEEWQKIAGSHSRVIGLLENFQDKNRSFKRVLSAAALTIKELKSVAEQLCQHIASQQSPDPDCVYKARELLRKIEQCVPPL